MWKEREFHRFEGECFNLCGRQRFVLHTTKRKGSCYFVKIVLVTLSLSIREESFVLNTAGGCDNFVRRCEKLEDLRKNVWCTTVASSLSNDSKRLIKPEISHCASSFVKIISIFAINFNGCIWFYDHVWIKHRDGCICARRLFAPYGEILTPESKTANNSGITCVYAENVFHMPTFPRTFPWNGHKSKRDILRKRMDTGPKACLLSNTIDGLSIYCSVRKGVKMIPNG